MRAPDHKEDFRQARLFGITRQAGFGTRAEVFAAFVAVRPPTIVSGLAIGGPNASMLGGGEGGIPSLNRPMAEVLGRDPDRGAARRTTIKDDGRLDGNGFNTVPPASHALDRS